MSTTSVDISGMFYRYVESEVKEGRYKSKAEAIRAMIRKEMEQKHSVGEKFSQNTVEKMQEARKRGDIEGNVGELIEDSL
ncbi:ribbon-helix-helix domain-containing protein [Haloferax volcanii]|uniref:Antitoxin ParD1/3/4 n=1 Tax=Haloferax volcanii TaxID=2246 RepID=A0A558G4Y8_HALVO|nr:type II toxin-antitoxin system ParD family antitoxin [Haloferax volcanii]TVT92816.1 hypothetical protein FQA18_16825 [Haloferax volcanii]